MEKIVTINIPGTSCGVFSGSSYSLSFDNAPFHFATQDDKNDNASHRSNSQDDEIDTNSCYLMIQNLSQNVSLSSSDVGGTLSKRDDDSRESSFGHSTLKLRLTANIPFHFATQDEEKYANPIALFPEI